VGPKVLTRPEIEIAAVLIVFTSYTCFT